MADWEADSDDESEFKPNGFSRKFSKNEQIYGVFGEEEDEDDSYGKRKGGRKKQDPLSGVAFVKSSNLLNQSKEKQKTDRDDDDEIQEISEDEDEANIDDTDQRRKQRRKSSEDSEEDDDENGSDEQSIQYMKTVSGSKKKQSSPERTSQKSDRRANSSTDKPSYLPNKHAEKPKEQKKAHPSSTAKPLSQDELERKYDFTKYTSGFALKMMNKMGFKGRMGLKEDGIDRAIEVDMYTGKGGIGTLKQARKEQPMTKSQEEQKMQQMQKEKETVAPPAWKKTTKRKVKVEYQSNDAILESLRKQPNKVVFTDMTGPRTRTVTLGGQMTLEEIEKANEGNCVELLYNIRLLKDRAELDIQKADGNIRKVRDQISSMTKSDFDINQRLSQQQKKLECFDTISKIIEPLLQRRQSKENPLTLEILLSEFSYVKGLFPDEFIIHNLDEMACGLGVPLLIQKFQTWSPLKEINYGYDDIYSWRKLLDANLAEMTSPYCRLISDAVLPRIRYTFVNEWNARQCDRAVDLMTTWKHLLPGPIMHNILNMLVIPKLRMAVESWNPRLDPVPIHLWLHPWLPLMASQMEPLYHSVKYQISTVLQMWHPSDPSALALLAPWKTVFDSVSLESMIRNFILPKLIHEMKNLILHPSSPYIDPLHWLMNWREILPVSVISTILEGDFFPKWFTVLKTLLAGNTNFEEVGNWYRYWKTVFPPDIHESDSVRRQFTRALDYINQAMSGETPVDPLGSFPLPPTKPVRPPPPSQSNSQPQQKPPPPPPKTVPKIFLPEFGALLKDEVQRMSELLNITFFPKKGTHDGKQIYELGPLSVYLDKDIVYVKEKSSWFPTDLESLFFKLHGSE